LGQLWHKSGSIERDNNDERAGGALAYFYEGGTTTPLVVYQDADETTPHEAPVEAASSGRWPTVFIPFCDSYDLRVTTEGGTQLYYPLEVPNPDPVEASEDSVEAPELIQTGMIAIMPSEGVLTGFVRLNGRSIGSATSGATERANADTADLYAFNWNNFSNTLCPVATGRGANAAADFAANKALTLLDGRSCSFVGADDMGNSAASLGYGGSFTTGDAITGGSTGGANTHALVTGELASHLHEAGTLFADSGGAHDHNAIVTDAGHTHTEQGDGGGGVANSIVLALGDGGAQASSANTTASATTGITVDIDDASTHQHAVEGSTANTGSGTAHNNMSRHIIVTFHQKL
jgi:hypothetical protein